CCASQQDAPAVSCITKTYDFAVPASVERLTQPRCRDHVAWRCREWFGMADDGHLTTRKAARGAPWSPFALVNCLWIRGNAPGPVLFSRHDRRQIQFQQTPAKGCKENKCLTVQVPSVRQI